MSSFSISPDTIIVSLMLFLYLSSKRGPRSIQSDLDEDDQEALSVLPKRSYLGCFTRSVTGFVGEKTRCSRDICRPNNPKTLSSQIYEEEEKSGTEGEGYIY